MNEKKLRILLAALRLYQEFAPAPGVCMANGEYLLVTPSEVEDLADVFGMQARDFAVEKLL